MKKYLLSVTLFLAVSFGACAQTDSVAVVNAKWETVKLTRGLLWKHYWFKKNLFDANQNVNILEINLHKKPKLSLGYEKQLLKPTSDFAKQAAAIAAINAGFFDVKNGGAVGFTRVNGEVISTKRVNKAGKRDIHQQAAVLFDKKKVNIAKWDGTDSWENGLTGDVLVSGPLLIYHNNNEVLDTSAFVRLRHQRTVLAITRNRVLLITIDGRHENAAGMNLHEVSKLLHWLHATDAINLDGGGSTTMCLKDQPANGVVNYPCDKKTWDHYGERKVANVILVNN